MSGSEARKELGLFLMGFRETYFFRMGQSNRRELSRRRLAGRAKTSEDVIKNLEHGVVNPDRAVFENVIMALRLTEENSAKALRLLDVFSSPVCKRKRKRIKFHLSFVLRMERNRSGRNHSHAFCKRSHR